MSPDQINQFFSFLYQGRVGEIAFWLRLVAGILSSAFFAAIFVIIIKFRELLGGEPGPAPVAESVLETEERLLQPWGEVMKRIDSPHPSDWNLAVIRADSIMDGVLKDMGLLGTTMGDRLKQLDRSKLRSLDGVWEAHKIRNRIAHEAEEVLTYQESRRAVMLFGEALKELGYLQE